MRCAAGRPRASAAGFTLLEVLVAAAVLAVILAVVAGVTRQHAAGAARLRDQTLAHWVALNRLAELRLAPDRPAPGVTGGQAELGGRIWLWTLEVAPTPDPAIRRAALAVRGEPAGPPLAEARALIGEGG